MRFDWGILRGFRRRAFYTFSWCFVAMLLIGLIADFSQRPFIFPSLGPSAIMLFAHPLRKDSSPRHTVFGHLIGVIAGYFALWVTGLLSVPFTAQHVGWHRVLAAAIALGLTSGAMILARSEHAPAGATTLIISLGILPQLSDAFFLMVAVVMLIVLALVINRLWAIPYPLWSPPHWVTLHDRDLVARLERHQRLQSVLRKRD